MLGQERNFLSTKISSHTVNTNIMIKCFYPPKLRNVTKKQTLGLSKTSWSELASPYQCLSRIQYPCYSSLEYGWRDPAAGYRWRDPAAGGRVEERGKRCC